MQKNPKKVMKQSWKTGVTDKHKSADRAELMGPSGKAG